MAQGHNLSIQSVAGWTGFIAKVQLCVFRSQLPDQSRHTFWRSIELAHVSDLSIPTSVCDRYRVAQLGNIDPNKDFLWRRHDPSSNDEDRILPRQTNVSPFGQTSRFSAPDRLSARRCAQPTSSMAAGHRGAAHSVLDDGEHNATLERFGLERSADQSS
jgi:hypothetical protein